MAAVRWRTHSSTVRGENAIHANVALTSAKTLNIATSDGVHSAEKVLMLLGQFSADARTRLLCIGSAIAKATSTAKRGSPQ
jgi:hypothetical protein